MAAELDERTAMNRRRTVSAVVALTPIVVGLGVFALSAPSSAQTQCGSFAALGSAAGVHTFTTSEGLLLTNADGNLPGAQAEVSFLTGSRSWAGAPYSSVAVENAARAAEPNDVPLFAVSSYPVQPKSRNSAPGATVEAKSGEQSAESKATAGASPSEGFAAGRTVTTAAAACTADGAAKATADTTIDMVDSSGVLRLASVRSHAAVTIGASGEPVFESSMVVEGASVLGVPVAVGDEGVIVGSTVFPTSDNPLSDALLDAGIRVRYIDAVENRSTGEVFAPGVEIVVTRGVEGVGSGPTTTTYVLGRAYARAGASPVAGPETPSGSRPPIPSGDSGSGDATEGALPVPSDPGSVARPRIGGAPVAGGDDVGGVLYATALSAQGSSDHPYAALATGALLSLAVWAGFERWGARIRWR